MDHVGQEAVSWSNLLVEGNWKACHGRRACNALEMSNNWLVEVGHFCLGLEAVDDFLQRNTCSPLQLVLGHRGWSLGDYVSAYGG